MEQQILQRPGKSRIFMNKVKTFLCKPQNVVLLVLGIILSVTTIAPIVSIFADTISIHVGSVDAHLTGKTSGYTLVNWIDLFTGNLSRQNVWIPLGNTLLLAFFTCLGAIIYGGIFAYLVTRTNLKFKKYLSAIFIFPYIMPQWTLAVVWQNLFNSHGVTGGSDGLLASLFRITMPAWWCKGLFPSAVVLALHYAPFAYIMIGGIFRNMDANLEEAAVILNTPKWRIFSRVTLPMIKPAILSTILLVFGSAMGSYPVPHYMNLTTLSTKYVSMNVNRAGEASILAIIMMVFGVVILMMNQVTTSSRKSYTTVTGKSGQISKVNLGRVGKYAIAAIFIILTTFTSIYPIISFAMETFLPNPGDYSFLTSGNLSNLTLKWWITSENLTENGMYGQLGILFNSTIWNAFKGTLIVSICCSLIIPIQKSSIISGYLLPFMTCLRELTLFMLLCSQNTIVTTLLDYFDEMGLYAFSSGINLILIIFIIICNGLINKVTGASLDKGIGGN